MSKKYYIFNLMLLVLSIYFSQVTSVVICCVIIGAEKPACLVIIVCFSLYIL